MANLESPKQPNISLFALWEEGRETLAGIGRICKPYTEAHKSEFKLGTVLLSSLNYTAQIYRFQRH